MPVLPFTGAPVTDLWKICLWMADRFRERFASVMKNGPAERQAE